MKRRVLGFREAEVERGLSGRERLQSRVAAQPMRGLVLMGFPGLSPQLTWLSP